MQRIIVVLLFVLSSLSIWAQQAPEKYSRIKIDLKNKDVLQLARLGLEVDHGAYAKGQYLINEFSASELTQIRNAGFSFEVLIDDLAKNYLEHWNDPVDVPAEIRNTGCNAPDRFIYETPDHYTPGSMGGYFKYNEMLGNLDDMKSFRPDLISYKAPISNTLTTIEGRPIYYVRISDNPESDENEPEMLYTALHHAREPNSMSQMIFYMWYLLEHYDTDPEIKYLIDHTELYFIPCVNVDGYLYNESTNPSGGGFWRKNRRDNGDGTMGVDINRNYGYNWGYNDEGSSPLTNAETYRGTAPFSEPEIEMVREFTDAHQFKMALNYHTYGDLFIYPWGYILDDCPDHDGFDLMAQLLTRDNNFVTGSSPNILYAVNGGSDDWMYGEQTEKGKIFSATAEVGPGFSGFWPQAGAIDFLNKSCMQQNLTAAEMLLNYGILTEGNPTVLSNPDGHIGFHLQRYGLSAGTLTVGLTPLSDNIASTGPAKLFDIAEFGAIDDSIAYSLKPTAYYGQDVVFELSLSNGLYTWRDTLHKVYGEPVMLFADAASNINNWLAQPPSGWGATFLDYHTAPKSFTDSNASDYVPNTANGLELKNGLDLSGYDRVFLSYWTKWDIEKDYDYAQVQISTNGGAYTPLCGKYTVSGGVYQNIGQPVYEGYQPYWVQEEIDITEYMGSNVKFNFLMVSNDNNQQDGIYIDDVKVVGVDSLNTSVMDLEDGDFVISRNYPNPAADYTTFEVRMDPAFAGPYRFEVIDVLGNGVKTGFLSENGIFRLDTHSWPAGIYYCQVSSGDRLLATRKIVVAH